ncbi:hypothetical protein [Pseudorhodoferax sp.]|uniref:hypothetical protein n=1 Tax=Pseudorhodoferax sp. TaxID=1993553 RepID=UPI002DD62ECA|nr:hypothetical protein [Pseudorhodoferax sp.]
MTTPHDFRLERHAMHALLIGLLLFAFWTVAHQLSTFLGGSWNVLTRATAWTALPAGLLAFLASGRLARIWSHHIAQPAIATYRSLRPMAWLACLVAFGAFMLVPSYPLRFTALMAGLGVLAFAQRKTSPSSAQQQQPSDVPQPRPARDATCLLLLVAIAVLVVLCANRSDFDDAEYLQSAIQTMRYPDRGIFTFDASLGIVLEPFRFAPYRLTSYETFVGLIAHATGADILDVYYLFVPGAAAALSVLAALVFLRWFLPLPWTLLAIAVFLAITLAWGEAHVAFGNRVYVRLFQGKGLLIAITSPMTIHMALLWMRRPSIATWLGLLAMQVVAVGVSSSGVVITLFSTAIGILSGLMAQWSREGTLRAAIGGLVLAYPMGLGLWLKYASSSSGKVEEIGTYLPINASFGSPVRELLTMLILLLACTVLPRAISHAKARDTAAISDRTMLWLVIFSFLLVLNPFLIAIITQATSQNMNWRLAWAAPVPLLLALGMVMLWRSAMGSARPRTPWLLGPIAVCAAFFLAAPWTLAPGNNVSWGWAMRKLPAEYAEAVVLSEKIRARPDIGSAPTVLVEPRVGTWLTVVAPDFKLVMPGHGYWVLLRTIMDPTDFQQRNFLLTKIDAIRAGDTSFDALMDHYGVDVVVSKPEAGPEAFLIQARAKPMPRTVN